MNILRILFNVPCPSVIRFVSERVSTKGMYAVSSKVMSYIHQRASAAPSADVFSNVDAFGILSLGLVSSGSASPRQSSAQATILVIGSDDFNGA